MRLIDADALIEKLQEAVAHKGMGAAIAGILIRYIEKLPTIEAEPVRHGRWISEKCNHKPYRIKNPEKWVIYKCSVCGYSNGRKQNNYCPNCWAKMDGEAHE